MKPVALVVEDEDIWAKEFETVLSPYFTVIKTNSVSGVQNFLNDNQAIIEIALVDIYLDPFDVTKDEDEPKASGLDVMYLLNQIGIPCICVTQSRNATTVRDALVLGRAKDVWFKNDEKPVILRKKIDEVLKYQEQGKDYLKEKIVNPHFPIVKNEVDIMQAFIIMPFNEPWSSEVLALAKSVAENFKINIIRADDIFVPQNIVNDIWQMINESGLIIADITVHNANVFYELGMAHALGKNVVLLRQIGGAPPPSDISLWRYFEYELMPIKVEEFRAKLSKIFEEYIKDHDFGI